MSEEYELINQELANEAREENRRMFRELTHEWMEQNLKRPNAIPFECNWERGTGFAVFFVFLGLLLGNMAYAVYKTQISLSQHKAIATAEACVGGISLITLAIIIKCTEKTILMVGALTCVSLLGLSLYTMDTEITTSAFFFAASFVVAFLMCINYAELNQGITAMKVACYAYERKKVLKWILAICLIYSYAISYLICLAITYSSGIQDGWIVSVVLCTIFHAYHVHYLATYFGSFAFYRWFYQQQEGIVYPALRNTMKNMGLITLVSATAPLLAILRLIFQLCRLTKTDFCWGCFRSFLQSCGRCCNLEMKCESINGYLIMTSSLLGENFLKSANILANVS